MKKVLVWIAALVITLTAAIYQRATGPTYPLKISAELAGKDFDFQLTRSASLGDGCTVEVPKSNLFDKAEIVFRKYPGGFQFDTLLMTGSGDNWKVHLPVQPAAAKLEYYAVLKNEADQVLYHNKQNTAIVRFKGDVPSAFLVPHVVAMFLAMLFSTAAALMAIFRIGNFRLIGFITLGLLVVGGLIFGPIVQYYAFGDAWTGWPYGKDLTDNKTLITAIFWIGAVLLNLKRPRRWAVILAAVVLLAVYSIPHSARGSEYNYDTGKVQTG